MDKKWVEYSADEQYVITEIAKCKPNMHYITFTDYELAQIDAFAKKKAIAKYGEAHHLSDGGQEYKRNYTGMMGEVAIEKLFGVPFVDWSIGASEKYNVADLRPLGYNVGIKTVEMGKFPLVRKDAYRPEIICVKRNKNTVVVCGLATTEVLIHNQNDKFVRSPNALRRGEKSAFVGFDKLVKIDSLEDLKEYRKYY